VRPAITDFIYKHGQAKQRTSVPLSETAARAGSVMAVIVKMQPAAPGPDGLLAVDPIWNYRRQTLETGDEAFVWFTKEGEAAGLAMRGSLEHIAPAGTSRNGRRLLSLRLSITDLSPARPFTVAALHPYKGSTAPGPLPKLADKLLGNSHRKVALLENDETQHLRAFFASPTGTLREQIWRELERDASLAARERVGARIRRESIKILHHWQRKG
jgi:hypothetical protein